MGITLTPCVCTVQGHATNLQVITVNLTMMTIEWFTIENLASGRVLDLCGGGAEGAELIIYDRNGGDNQLWQFDEEGRIISKTGFCLDIEGCNDENCAKVIAWSPHDGDNQKWEVVGTRIESRMNGKVLDILYEGTDNETPVIVHDHHGKENQRWNIIPHYG